MDLIIISLKINLFLPWYSWKIAELALNNIHSLTHSRLLLNSKETEILQVTHITGFLSLEWNFLFRWVVNIMNKIICMNSLSNHGIEINSWYVSRLKIYMSMYPIETKVKSNDEKYPFLFQLDKQLACRQFLFLLVKLKKKYPLILLAQWTNIWRTDYERKFKLWWSKILPISSKRTTTSHLKSLNTEKKLLLEIKVLPWDRHKNVTGLNCNTNISIQLEKKPAQIRLQSKRPYAFYKYE